MLDGDEKLGKYAVAPGGEAAARAQFGPMLFVHLVLALRPKQWTKNGIIFAGLIFSMNLLDVNKLVTTVLAFVVFCLLSSGIYLVNDLADLENDRLHPRKRLRPLAAGLIKPWHATSTAVALFAICLPVAFRIGWLFGATALAYVVIMLGYSFVLKHVLIIDVFTIAGGFLLRAVGGAVAISVPVSPWLYLCTLLLALFLGLSKRRHELILLNENALNHRKILDEYSIPLLEEMISVVAASTVMAYSLYTFFAETLPRNHYMMATIPFVLYAIFRYLYLVYKREEGGSPEQILIKDIPLGIDIVLWGMTVVAILYIARQYPAL